MSLLVVPNTFTNGTGPANIIDATQMNANFTAVATAVNNIYPSQILPITTAQATFGATATGVGYKFLANDATAVPLIVSGVSGQSADIQQWIGTNTLINTLSVDKGGILTFHSGGSGTSTNVFINNDNGATNGMFLNVPAASTNGFQFLVGAIGKAQITSGGAILAGSATAPAVSAGDIAASRSTTTGLVKFGGSSTSGIIDWNIITAGQISLTTGAGAFAAFSAGAYTNASDISLKANVAPVVDSLSVISQLKPSSFKWIADDSNDVGFVAQDIAAVMPDAITTFTDGTLGYKPVAILAHLVAAFQDHVQEFNTLKSTLAPAAG